MENLPGESLSPKEAYESMILNNVRSYMEDNGSLNSETNSLVLESEQMGNLPRILLQGEPEDHLLPNRIEMRQTYDQLSFKVGSSALNPIMTCIETNGVLRLDRIIQRNRLSRMSLNTLSNGELLDYIILESNSFIKSREVSQASYIDYIESKKVEGLKVTYSDPKIMGRNALTFVYFFNQDKTNLSLELFRTHGKGLRMLHAYESENNRHTVSASHNFSVDFPSRIYTVNLIRNLFYPKILHNGMPDYLGIEIALNHSRKRDDRRLQ